ncbi:fibronectin type III domain-containing protein 9-like [Pelodiscus sinensis]|uniref:Fibronectin type III domain-containing protein 9-like n=1 Tax=Pelodiscus sinensis TaxID=13735 RepID=K7EX61_PELSI|nr:fibronectin type III domain-containing protein 9-like [Pelodiscus sinensis]|eukprot:XP_006135887.1 fibronectin type III domain-containing protein 9-like [Pelodiscus sinensis]
MGVTIQNVTGSTAMVIWPTMASCADSFYSIMYHPNWNNMLSGYSRKNFQKEERVPASRSSFVIENLTPLTTYILCVTCQSANPSSDQCRIFHTLEEDPASASNKKKELALGIWLTSSILLLIIAGILLYGCLHIWCRKRRERAEGQNIPSEQDKGEAWTINKSHTTEEFQRQDRLVQSAEGKNADDIQLATIIENPLTSKEPAMQTSKSQEIVLMTAGPL